MSEFKYACPVCGQHIKCDSSQAGSVMECPTCFQKITVPQAPASDEQKFIITGSKVTDKKKSGPVDAGGMVGPEKKSPFAVIVIVIAILAAAAAGIYFFGGKRISEKPSDFVSSSAWQSGDIGDVGAAGSVSQSNGVFTINGSGADIWHRADGFYYVFQPLNGDGSLTAQVLNIKNTDEWAKAGVMIRESTNAGSVFALASIRSDGQAQLIWRNATGQEAQASGLAGGTGFPKWVKIVRSGNSFSVYFKVNAGDAWAQLGASQTISMSPSTQIGLIVCAHNAGTLCQAQFNQMTLQAALKTSPAAISTVPKLIAPPASGTNWTLNLDAQATPDSVAAGRVHGKFFVAQRMILDGVTLTLRTQDSPPEAGVSIYLHANSSEELAGQTINVKPDTANAPWVNLRWKDAQGQAVTLTEKSGYAMRIEFGQIAGGHVSGKIYLCTPDEMKSLVVGVFNAKIKKPKPPQ